MTKLQTAGLLTLLTVFLLLATAGLWRATPTYDEARHFQYGEKILRLAPERDDATCDSKMPVSALNVLPWKIAKVLGLDSWLTNRAIQRYAGAHPTDEMVQIITARVAIMPGKIVTIMAALLLGWLVFTWARELYGVHAGLVALAFYVFSPNILANANLVTVDLYAALSVTLALYCYWKFANRGGGQWATGSALALAAGQLVKYTCLFLYPIFLLIAAVRVRNWRTGRALRLALLYVLVSVAVINVGFVFSGTGTPLAEYRFRSSLFQNIQDRLAAVGFLPVPVPYPFLDGVDYVAYHEQTGINHGRVYLLGKLAPPGQGFPGYYFVATLFKAPLAVQILFWTALVIYVARFRWERFVRDEVFLLVPIVFFAIYFNFFFRTQIGMRFFIVIFPLCHVFLSHLFQNWGDIGRARKYVLAGLLGYQAISVVSYCPHFLAYFNELVPDRKMAYRILADSNLDWGQSRWYLERYRATHPAAIFAPTNPVAGTIVVPVNDLVGITDPEKYRWLRDNFRPHATIAHSYLVFEVPPAAVPK